MRISHCCDDVIYIRLHSEIALQDTVILTIQHLFNAEPARKAMSLPSLRRTSLSKPILESHSSPDFYF